MSLKELFLSWHVRDFDKRGRNAWRLAVICLFWCLWKEWNDNDFIEEELSIKD